MADSSWLRQSVAQLRENYTKAGLSEADLAPDPILQFERWFGDAVQAGLREPNAMTLATATPAGEPSARIVLLKSYDERGFVFYSNYQSRKGRELEVNPRAALIFYWADLERQVRITGTVSRVSRDETAAYFRSRPRGSQIGAWASRQSDLISRREDLEARVEALLTRFGAEEIPVPEFWGGYRVRHETVEFWQGRPSRLHDRLEYHRDRDGWRIVRLSP